ncbi:TPA: hypothetical protein HA295_04055 [Candidatus Woesearchaeota archaeon]|nr:hypothetical protein [Candidatus Woesearchaeota archaeon]HII65922.1 hypothetical protein [Candidatus Woesearchaeota archaeon]
MAKEYIPKGQKKKRNWLALAFLVFMVIGMSSGFVFFGFGSDTKRTFNGHAFNYRGDHWETKVNGAVAAFTYPPESVTIMSMPPEAAQLLSGKIQLDTTSYANDTLRDAIALSQYQLGLVLAAYNVYVRPGYTSNDTSFAAQFPPITCGTATSFVPVIYLTSANQTAAHVEGNCLIIQAATAQDMILMKDRLLYAMLGIA